MTLAQFFYCIRVADRRVTGVQGKITDRIHGPYPLDGFENPRRTNTEDSSG